MNGFCWLKSNDSFHTIKICVTISMEFASLNCPYNCCCIHEWKWTFIAFLPRDFQHSPVFYRSCTFLSRFFADRRGIGSEFSAVFTALRLTGATEDVQECPEDEYDCDDATCIARDLVCNGVRNCKFGWDEETCRGESSIPLDFTATHVIVILILLIVIMCGMCAGMFFNLVRKLTEDKEDIIKSREKSLGNLATLPGIPSPAKPKTPTSSVSARMQGDFNGCHVPTHPGGGFGPRF